MTEKTRVLLTNTLIPEKISPNNIQEIYDLNQNDNIVKEMFKFIILSHLKEIGVISWGDENLVGPIYLDLVSTIEDKCTNFFVYMVFDSEDDAILFKMTWC